MKKLFALVVTVGLAACAVIEEEMVIVEPVVEEPVIVDDQAAPAKPPLPCEDLGDDGIGGTGCPAEP